jgi:uroporphyrinogen decarboxylase
MNARERVLTAMDGGEPDRVPCALGFYHMDLEHLVPGSRGRDERVDVQFVQFPLSLEEEALERLAEPYAPDTRLGSASQVATYALWDYRPQTPEYGSPLAQVRSLEELRRFPFPDVSSPYAADGLARQVQELHARGLAAGGNLPHLGGELFEAAWRLRGLENFLFDLVERPEWAHFLLDRLADMARRNAETLARAGVDVLALDDDVGMPGTMIISPDTWRTFFRPRLALWGTVGRQTTFSFAQPDDIRREVRERIETLGRAGLILCPAYDADEPDIPRENVAAFLDAVREYG